MSDLVTQTPTLPRLLEVMDALDQGLLNLPLEEMALVGEQARDKVDGIYRYFQAVEARREQLKSLMDQLKELYSQLGKRQEAFEAFLASQMQEHGLKSLPGREFEMIFRENPPSTEIVGSPEFTPEFLEKYRCYIRTKTTHEFDKTALKKDLAEGAIEIPFAKLKRTTKVVFSLKRKELAK